MNIRVTMKDSNDKESKFLIEGIKSSVGNNQIQAGVKCITNNSTLELFQIEKGGEYENIGLGN